MTKTKKHFRVAKLLEQDAFLPSEQLDITYWVNREYYSFILFKCFPPSLIWKLKVMFSFCNFSLALCVFFEPPGDDAMTGDTDKYLAPQDLRELGDDSLPQEGYMGFSVGARSQR